MIVGYPWAQEAAFWGPVLVPAAARLARKHDFQAIVTTGAPFMANYWMARGRGLVPSVPLVQEFRDPWVELPDDMLRAEGIPCSSGYVPLNRTPAIRRALAEQEGRIEPWDAADAELPALPPCPVAEDLCQRTIWLKQTMFLGDHEDMDDIVAAIAKVQHALA